MSVSRAPRDIARRLGEKSRAQSAGRRVDNWRREWFDRYPKAAYMTEIEFWRELEDGRIEFTIRRLPSAD